MFDPVPRAHLAMQSEESRRISNAFRIRAVGGGNVCSRRRRGLQGVGSPITGRIDDIIDMQAHPNPPFVSVGTPLDQNHTPVPVNPQPYEECTGQVISDSCDLAIIKWSVLLHRLPLRDQNLLYLYGNEVTKYFDMYLEKARKMIRNYFNKLTNEQDQEEMDDALDDLCESIVEQMLEHIRTLYNANSSSSGASSSNQPWNPGSQEQ